MKDNQHLNRRSEDHLPGDDQLNDDQLYQACLERLVDNDLNHQEYQRVLTLVSDRPDGWKNLAIAFLESQALSNELSEMAAMGLGLEEDTPSASSEKQPSSLADEATILSRLQKIGLIALPVIAACILITYSASVYFDYLQNNVRRNEVVSIPEPGNHTLAGSVTHYPNQANYVHLVGEHSNQGVRAPVINQDHYDPNHSAAEYRRLTDTLEKFQKNPNLNVHERQHVLPIRDDAGNKIILPMTEIEFEPKRDKHSKWEAYQ